MLALHTRFWKTNRNSFFTHKWLRYKLFCVFHNRLGQLKINFVLRNEDFSQNILNILIYQSFQEKCFVFTTWLKLDIAHPWMYHFKPSIITITITPGSPTPLGRPSQPIRPILWRNDSEHTSGEALLLSYSGRNLWKSIS